MKRLALTFLLLMTAGTALAKEAVPFLENDYAKALASAKTKKLPIFVEAWAPW